MLRIGRTLYAQIAGMFLLLLLTFFVVTIAFIAREFGAFLEELEQRLNSDLAAHLASELQPHIRDQLLSPGARDSMRRALELNPALDIYVLKASGSVAAVYPADRQLKRRKVDTAPITVFLSDSPMLPQRAVDPASEDGDKVFSAASLQLPGGAPGYLFAILQGQPLDTAASMMQNSYIVRSVAVALLLALLAVTIAGFLSFAHLTRRFRRLTDTVHSFREGRYMHRVAVTGNDEIGRLALAVNQMAGTIEAQVEALRRTDEDRRLLVANLSHDFRTPLTSLRGYSQRLNDSWEQLDATQREDCLQAILNNTQQLEHLAAQLASLSRLDTSSQSMQKEAFSLEELVQDVAIRFRPTAEARALSFSTEHSSSARVWGDISLIERVVANLLDNALRNTPEGGSVSVAVECLNGGTQLTVSDTGYGIREEELALVKQRFYRTERSRVGATSGSGLGLAIAEEILALHDTSLEISSSVGEGTTVSFVLPIASADANGI